MKINSKSLEKLRNLINEETEYRSGPKLIKFFNKFGFSDEYDQGFPSRWQYTDEKLSKLNGTEKLKDVITELFNPINYVERIEDLDKYINELNQYLTFDKKEIKRYDEKILILESKKIKIPKKNLILNTKNLNTENDDIFILEPNFYGIGIKLKNLWNRCFKNKK